MAAEHSDELVALRAEVKALRAALVTATPAAATESLGFLFDGQKQAVIDDVREFMLAHCNIREIPDTIEGSAYDFVVEKIWDLTVGRWLA